MLTLRPMTVGDLARVSLWLGEAHVARWYLAGSSADTEIDELRTGLADSDPTTVLVVERDGRPVGWCQWYRCDAYPDWASDVGARPGDVGIDYAIGDPALVGQGLGTELIATLVAEVRRAHPAAGVLADPDAANMASRRVLEHNGFALMSVGPVPSEPSDAPMAVYRLDGEPT